MRYHAFVASGLSGLALAFPSLAIAGPCEDSFDRRAKVFKSMQFSAQVEVPGMSVDSAFQQLRTVFPNYGIRVIREDRASGQLNAETAESIGTEGKPVDIFYSNAGNRGLVQMTYSRATNLLRKKTAIRTQMCAILNQLTAARPMMNGGAQPYGGQPVIAGAITIESVQLAQQVNAARDNPARIRTLFSGNLYRMSGRILSITETKKGRYAVAFEGGNASVTCQTASGQDRAIALLETGRRETLVGRFSKFDEKATPPAAVLEDCKAP